MMEEAQKWMEGHLLLTCPSCGQCQKFTILDQLIVPPLILPGSPNAAIPMVGVVCTNCANIRFFSAVMMGIKPQ